MGFDTKAFDRAKFEDRTVEVAVPALSDFFGEGEKAVFRVRGLTGEEIYRCHEAGSRIKRMQAAMDGMESELSKDQIEAFKKLFGTSDSVPEEFAKHLAFFTAGVVEPEMTHDRAVRIAENFGGDFKVIVHKVLELSGMGRQVKKKSSSGKTKKSEQH